MIKKIIIVIVIVIVFTLAYFYSLFEPAKQIEWGVTFSPRHAEYLGFDWKTVFIEIINDLKPKHLRLMTYWEDLESTKGKFDFQMNDEMLIEAEKRNIDVILVVGLKQPRWPECHNPAWYNDLPEEEKTSAQLNMVKAAVEHFKSFPAIKAWQVENEPLFSFGPMCPKTDKKLLKQEIALVRSLDQRPIILTDSGELGRWVPLIKTGKPDIFGSTMYRIVHSPHLGYFKYPLPPAFFRIKAGIVKRFTGISDIIGVELQAEPWFSDDVFRTDLKTQNALMNPIAFEKNIEYAKKVGFRENYLWGVEWWYWQAKRNNDWGMWDKAKQLFAE